MNMLYNISEYIASFIECYTLICVYSMFFDKRFSLRLHIGMSTFCCIFVMFITKALNSISLFSMYTIYIWAIVLFVFGFLLYRANVVKLFCVLALYLVFLGTFELFFMAILELIFGVDGFVLTVISQIGLYRTIYILSVKILIFLIYVIISRNREKYEFSFGTGLLLTLYGVLFFSGLQSMVNAIVTEDIIYMRRSVLLSLVFVLLFMLIVFIMLRINAHLKRERMENSIITASMKILENDNRQLNDAYREIAKISHDHRNHIQTAAVLLQNEKYCDLSRYFNEIIEDLHNVKIKQYTSLDIIDAVINSKVLYAERCNITVNVSTSYPIYVAIRQTDVCALLVNLIDNAIEACNKVENPDQRYINIGISTIGEMIVIKIENSYDFKSSILKSGGELRTTKENADLHGYGIKIVKSIVEKYNGSLEIEHYDDCFIAIAMLSYGC